MKTRRCLTSQAGDLSGNRFRPSSHVIRLKTQAPIFFAALAEVHSRLEPHEGNGFVIFTAARDQGIVDLHARGHEVFSPERVREWLENELAQKNAKELALSCCLPTKDFELYTAGNAVGNVKNQGFELVWPLKS